VLLETGQAERGSSWLTEWQSAWRDPGRQFGAHLTWHNGLFDLVLGDSDSAAAKLEEILDGDPFAALMDGASLAWRMSLDGIDIGDSPERLVTVPLPGPFSFIVAHRALALALAHDRESLEALAAEEESAPDGGPIAAELAVWTRALIALAGDAPEEAVTLLESIAPSFHRFGGSNAQTEVFEDTLIAALSLAGRTDDAAASLRHRLDRRASARDSRWLATLA
jgi:hypothetical protein